MALMRKWRVTIGCAGLVALAGLATRIPSLLHMVNVGEVSVAMAWPVWIGIVLMLIGCLLFLFKSSTGGILFASTTIAFILGLALLPVFVLSFWPGVAAAVACVGAVVGFTPSSSNTTKI